MPTVLASGASMQHPYGGTSSHRSGSAASSASTAASSHGQDGSHDNHTVTSGDDKDSPRSSSTASSCTTTSHSRSSASSHECCRCRRCSRHRHRCRSGRGCSAGAAHSASAARSAVCRGSSTHEHVGAVGNVTCFVEPVISVSRTFTWSRSSFFPHAAGDHQARQLRTAVADPSRHEPHSLDAPLSHPYNGHHAGQAPVKQLVPLWPASPAAHTTTSSTHLSVTEVEMTAVPIHIETTTTKTQTTTTTGRERLAPSHTTSVDGTSDAAVAALPQPQESVPFAPASAQVTGQQSSPPPAPDAVASTGANRDRAFYLYVGRSGRVDVPPTAPTTRTTAPTVAPPPPQPVGSSGTVASPNHWEKLPVYEQRLRRLSGHPDESSAEAATRTTAGGTELIVAVVPQSSGGARHRTDLVESPVDSEHDVRRVSSSSSSSSGGSRRGGRGARAPRHSGSHHRGASPRAALPAASSSHSPPSDHTLRRLMAAVERARARNVKRD